MDNLPYREVRVFTPYDGGDFSADGPRPPRSAKHVVTLEWTWGPAQDSVESYWLHTDRQRSAWHMTITTMCEGDCLYARVATLRPWKGTTPREAAAAMVEQLWRAELAVDGGNGPGGNVVRAGLLAVLDIKRIEKRVFGPAAVATAETTASPSQAAWET